MKPYIILAALGASALVAAGVWLTLGKIPDTVATENAEPERFSDTEAGFEETEGAEPMPVGDMPAPHYAAHQANATSLPPIPEPRVNGRVQWAAYWQPMTAEELAVYGAPIGPFSPRRVGIQVGHWQREDAPEELASLRDNSGANVEGVSEAAVMLEIGELVAQYLEAEGVAVDLLPVTIPVDYRADAFVSLHGDGSSDTSIRGFKVAAPRTDFSGRANNLKAAIDEAYRSSTELREDTAITRRMTGYYAFNWRRYDHAVHPQTPAVIVETGFLTNASDRAFLVNEPETSARVIADGILAFLAQN